MKILNIEPEGYSAKARAILKKAGRLTEKRLTGRSLIKEISGYDVLITRLGQYIGKNILSASPRLKAVATATTGLDHIDTDHAAKLGIRIISLRGETKFLKEIYATPENTWAVLLSLLRKIPWAFDSVRAGKWNRDLFKGGELAGKRLGVLGLGRVGEKVAGYGLAFNMRVSFFDPDSRKHGRNIKKCRSLKELLKSSDVLSVNASLNKGTVNMLGKKELSLLPKGAILINTARGAIIDHRALLGLLKSGHIGGAALDVLPEEQKKGSSIRKALIKYASRSTSLLVTPHISGATYESMEKTEIFIAQKILKFAAER